MALFRLNRVSLAFGDLPIFTEVDFAIEPGERVCLIGRNGAGKTTLLRLVTGALAPDAEFVGETDRFGPRGELAFDAAVGLGIAREHL